MKKLPCLEAHSIPYFQYKLQKITTILDASSRVTKSPKSQIGGKGAFQYKLQKITTILDASSRVTKSPKSQIGEKGALGVKEWSSEF
jgi:hypothetical protein